MTTSSCHPGYTFSASHLDDELGLGHLVVERFHELAEEAGDPSIRWSPQTSEVYYECTGQSPVPMTPIYELTRELESMREQAEREVWAAIENASRPNTVDSETWDDWKLKVADAISRLNEQER